MTRRLVVVAGVALTVMTAMPLSVTSQSASESEDVVRSLYTAFNARDAVALVAHVSADVQWMRVTGDAVVVDTSGREALRASMAGYFQSLPKVRSHIAALMSAGEFVTVHERVTWMRGATETTQSAVAVYRLQNARIVSVWYFDTMA